MEIKSFLATKDERTEYRKTHDTYFKCKIRGHWLSLDKVDEDWGYALTSDLKVAKRLFMKECDEHLDGGVLDYGFMHIAQFKKQDDKWVNVGEWVNFFGKWLTLEKFKKVAYGD